MPIILLKFLFYCLVNKLPNIDTDVESNFSVRGEFAYLIPGSPKVADLNGKPQYM